MEKDDYNLLDLTTRRPQTSSKFDVLCSDHFSAEDFIPSKQEELKILKDAPIPSTFSWKIQY